MKNIVVNGRKFQYEVSTDQYCFTTTRFYDGLETIVRKKYFFFGKLIGTIKPKLVFVVEANIEASCFSKEQVLKMIESKLKIYNRQIEINNGIIV